MTGLGDRVRALHLGRRVDGGDPLLNTVWLDVPELRDALADALEEAPVCECHDVLYPIASGKPRERVICRRHAALAALARQLEDGAA